MKDAINIPNQQRGLLRKRVSKWGELNRVYMTPNATAHAQYARVPGEDYSRRLPAVRRSAASRTYQQGNPATARSGTRLACST